MPGKSLIDRAKVAQDFAILELQKVLLRAPATPQALGFHAAWQLMKFCDRYMIVHRRLPEIETIGIEAIRHPGDMYYIAEDVGQGLFRDIAAKFLE